MRLPLILVAALSLSVAQAAEPALDPAIRYPAKTVKATPPAATNFQSRVNEFLTVRAKDHPEWWADQRIYREGETVPAGWMVVRAARGAYLVRVRTFAELSPEQQKAVFDDDLWASFLRTKRDKKLYPGSSTIYDNSETQRTEGGAPTVGVKADEQEPVWRINMDASELVLRRPTEVRLAPKRSTQ